MCTRKAMCLTIAIALLSRFLLHDSLSFAAEHEPATPPRAPILTVSMVLSLVEKSNDELAGLRAEAERARLRWKEVGRLWGPKISFTGATFESKGALGFGIGGFGSFGSLGDADGSQPQVWMPQQNGDEQPALPSTTKGALISAQASAILYSGGQLESGRDQAFWAYQAAIANYERRRNEIFLDVIKAGLAVLNFEHQLQVADRALASLQELERITGKRVDAGAAARVELLRVQAQLAQAQVERLRLQNLLEVARSFLRSLMGLPADAPVTLADFAPQMTIAEPEADVAALRKEARSRRPEIKLADAQIAIGLAARKFASAGYKPAVQISASRSWFDSNSFSEDTSWGVFLGVSWTLYDHGAVSLRVLQARRQTARAQAQRNQTARLIDVDIDRAVSELTTAYHSYQAAQKGLDAARENLRLARLRYETGFSTHIEALDAERVLSEAEARFQQTIYDYLGAKAALWKAVGRPLPHLPV
jgi:outer membrane protein TolC